MSTAGPLEDVYTRNYFNSPKVNIDNSFLSLETLTNSPKFSVNEKNTRNGERKREIRISDFDNLFEDENKLSDKSSTLYRNSNEFDTFLPCIESVVTDSDFSDLAQEFAEFGKSFSKDNISYEEEDSGNFSLFPVPKPKKEFSEKFKVEIDPKTKYTYNNLYNINTEIYSSASPKSSPYNKNTDEKETKKFVNDADRLDLRFIQNALLFDSKKDEREIYNPNENILKALYETPSDKKSTKSFMDIDNDTNSFNNNSKRLSAITKVEKDILINEDDISLNSKPKNRNSYQSNYQYPYQSTRPTYLTSHQPAQPPQFNIYNKNYPKRISTSPKPSPLSESNVDHYTRMDTKPINKAELYDYKGYFALDKPNNNSNDIQSREIPSNDEYNIDNSTSSDDIPLANITSNLTDKKIKPSSTPTLSALSISVPGDKSKNSYIDKSKKLNSKPLIDLSSENTNLDYLKSEISSPIIDAKKERKVSIKVPKRKKKKQLFSYCCSSKVLDNSYVEDGNRSYNKDLYIKCQKEQIHSFETKRMNSAKNKNYTPTSSNLVLSSIQNDSMVDKTEKSKVSFQPNYLSRKSSDGSSDNLSGVSSVSSSSSSSSSESENGTSSSSTFESIINDDNSIKSYLKSEINDKSPQKTIVVPSNQTNTQYIHSKKEKISDEMSSPISNSDVPASPNSYNSTLSSSEQRNPVPSRRSQEAKYCTSYKLCEDGNWRLV